MPIRRFEPSDTPQIVDLSMRAWMPVFEKLQPAVPPYVYDAFYPKGWDVRQKADIEKFLVAEGDNVFVAMANGNVAGFVGIRIHPDDRMGEVYILAVDPAHQREGIASALIEFALGRMREAGLSIAMVETGDDPGHAPSRAAYKSAGFERWPVARYFRKL
jgi:ribosomal protein S18 acetylase RimI-like enzyme